MKVKRLSLIPLMAFFIWASPAQGAETGPGKFVISFVIGQAEIVRGGTRIMASNGETVREGDIFHLKEKSAVEITSESVGTSCRISGPAIFRFSAANINAKIKRAGLLYSLMKKLTDDVVHYSPRTVVTAVRGKDDPAREAAAAAKLKAAMSLYGESKYDEAWTAFDELSREQGLKKHTEMLIRFYQAEILFFKMDYAGALALYIPLHQGRSREFKHGEICLGKAIICAAYTGDEILMKQLAAQYKEEYGESGAYSPAISAVMQE